MHLATAGQQILSDYEYSLIVAPSEISLLAEAPLKTREVLVDTIFNQIAISQRQRDVSTYNAWAAGDLSSLSIQSGSTGFPNDPGVPASGNVGVDYAVAGGWLVGGAISIGTTTQTFGSGGNFLQNEFAASAFAAFNNGPVWADIAGSFGALQDRVNRVAPIGITSQSNTGQTSGTNVSLAVEGGYNFFAGPLMHGPVAGMVLQQVHIGGYTETDAFRAVGGFTALSFGDQIRNSAVSVVGYEAGADIGSWHPFAKLVWNHELAATDRSVTASLTSVSAPGYSMPAIVPGADWATATVGTTVVISRGMTAYATFYGEIGQSNVAYYGGEVGLNVSLNMLVRGAGSY